MGFEGRKKGKYAGAEKFIKKMKEIQEEAKAVLGKAQENMKKYADKKRGETNDYRVGVMRAPERKEFPTHSNT